MSLRERTPHVLWKAQSKTLVKGRRPWSLP